MGQMVEEKGLPLEFMELYGTVLIVWNVWNAFVM